MNAKLPFVIVLLATVVFFWSQSERTGIEAFESESGTSNLQAPGTRPNGTGGNENRKETSTQANLLLTQAADVLFHGRPLSAKARFIINLFDEKLQAPGSYLQAGQGSRKSRLEFHFESNKEPIYFLQISDGRFFYSFRQVGDTDQLRSVDLKQIEELADSKSSFVAGPRAWLSVGNLASLLEHLAKECQFDPVRKSELAPSVPVHIVSGRWKHQSLVRLLEGQAIDFNRLKSDDWWKFMPEHFPHQVEITLADDERFPLFPYRIVFSQFKSSGNGIVNVPMVTLELFEVRHEPNIPDEMFQVASTNHESRTEYYVERVKQFTRRNR